jgi:hypothetical protein
LPPAVIVSALFVVVLLAERTNEDSVAEVNRTGARVVEIHETFVNGTSAWNFNGVVARASAPAPSDSSRVLPIPSLAGFRTCKSVVAAMAVATKDAGAPFDSLVIVMVDAATEVPEVALTTR